MSYTTLGQVALSLNKDELTLTPFQESVITQIIGFVDGIIDNYCGMPLLETAYTDKRYNGSGTDILDLGLFPVNTITTVRDKAVDGTFTDITSTIDILEDGLIQINPAIGGTFTSGSRNIYCTFTAGWETVPADLAYAATEVARLHFRKTETEMFGIKEQKFENTTVTMESDEIPVWVKRVLDRYRKVSIY